MEKSIFILLIIGTGAFTTTFTNLLASTIYTATVRVRSTNADFVIRDGGESDPISALTFSPCTPATFAFEIS